MEGMLEILAPLGVGGVLAFFIFRAKEQSDKRHEEDVIRWQEWQKDFSERSLKVISDNTTAIASVVKQMESYETLQQILQRIDQIENASKRKPRK